MNLPLIMMTKITAKITKRRTIAMRTATIGSSLMGLFEAKSVVVAANCFSAGCKRKYFLKGFFIHPQTLIKMFSAEFHIFLPTTQKKVLSRRE